MRSGLHLALWAFLAAAPAAAQTTPSAAITAAQTPGPAQQRLNALVGTFNVTVSIWVTPQSVPIVSNAAAVGRWVMDGRFVETSLTGYVGGDRFDALSLAGHDNASNTYQATWIDNRSTEMTWYSGIFGSDGKTAVLSGSVTNPVTRKREPLELRMSLDKDGNRITELWGKGGGKTLFKMMELRFVRTN